MTGQTHIYRKANWTLLNIANNYVLIETDELSQKTKVIDNDRKPDRTAVNGLAATN